VFAGFRDDCLCSGSGLLDPDAMEGLHAQTAAPGPASVQPTKLLLALMALAVFERLCRTLRHGRRVEPLGPPSPHAVEPAFASVGPARRSAS
jgi:hypothetical protein